MANPFLHSYAELRYEPKPIAQVRKNSLVSRSSSTFHISFCFLLLLLLLLLNLLV